MHQLPLFHRGYTATPPQIDFQGRKEFLVDFSTWPGASGSPVLLYEEGITVNRQGGVNLGGSRTMLLGIVYGVGVEGVNGKVIIQSAPVIVPGQMLVPTNLGACIKAERILDFEPLFVSRGVKPPAGYKMRSA